MTIFRNGPDRERVRRRPAFAGLAAFASIVLLAGCGSGAGQLGSAGAGQPGVGGEAAVGEMRAAIEPVLGCVVDYQPMNGPRAMGSKAQLVVGGETGEPRPSQVQFRRNGEVAQVETDIIPIRISKVLADSSKFPSESVPAVIELELCAVSGTNQPDRPRDRAAGLAAIAGRDAVAYLVETRGTGPGRVGYPKPAQKPKVEFGLASPEGFLMESSSGTGVYGISLGEYFPRADLTDFYPGRRKFPPKKRQ